MYIHVQYNTEITNHSQDLKTARQCFFFDGQWKHSSRKGSKGAGKIDLKRSYVELLPTIACLWREGGRRRYLDPDGLFIPCEVHGEIGSDRYRHRLLLRRVSTAVSSHFDCVVGALSLPPLFALL